MVPSAVGAIVLFPFPFSDLTNSKLRPAIVLAAGGRGDWVCAQITSRAYGDPLAVILDQQDFAVGSLRTQSFMRPAKLFTANEDLFVSEVATLNAAAIDRVISAVVALFRK